MDPEASRMFGDIFECLVFTVVALIFIVALLLRLWFCSSNRRRRSASPPDEIPIRPPPAPAHNTRLDPWLFQFLPTFVYSSSSAATNESSRPPPECAICLMEFQEGHRGRVLPNCNHVFHRHCIDKWLRSHSSCPLCRKVVDPPRIWSQNENREACVGEGQSGGFSNVNLPPPIRCPRKTLQVIELMGVAVEIPEEDHHRRQRTSSAWQVS